MTRLVVIKQRLKVKLDRPSWMRGICVDGDHIRINVGTEQDQAKGHELVTELLSHWEDAVGIRVEFEVVGDIVAQGERYPRGWHPDDEQRS